MRPKPPNNTNAARAGGGAAKDWKALNSPSVSTDLPKRKPNHRPARRCPRPDRPRYRAAQPVIRPPRMSPLRLDVDDARAMVASFKRDCRFWLPYEEAAS